MYAGAEFIPPARWQGLGFWFFAGCSPFRTILLLQNCGPAGGINSAPTKAIVTDCKIRRKGRLSLDLHPGGRWKPEGLTDEGGITHPYTLKNFLSLRGAQRRGNPYSSCSAFLCYEGKRTDCYATCPAGLCRGQPLQAALSPAQCVHWLAMTVHVFS